jgi:hypothetical protein
MNTSTKLIYPVSYLALCLFVTFIIFQKKDRYEFGSLFSVFYFEVSDGSLLLLLYHAAHPT